MTIVHTGSTSRDRTVTGPVDPSTAAGQFILACCGDDDGAHPTNPITMPTGFVQQSYNANNNSGSSLGNSAICYLLSSAGTGATLTGFTAVDANVAIVECLESYTGVDATTPINAIAATKGTLGGGSAPQAITAPSVTTTVDGCLILVVTVMTTNGGMGNVSGDSTSATGFTARGNKTSLNSFWGQPTTLVSVLEANSVQTTHGATGTTAATTSANFLTTDYVVYTIALAPASGAASDAITGSRSQAGSGAAKDAPVATPSAAAGRSRSGATTWSVNTVQTAAHSLATSGAAIDVAVELGVGADSGLSGASNGIPVASLSASRSLARSGAASAVPSGAPSPARALERSGSASALLSVVSAASQSLARSGANVDTTSAVSAPSASRSLASSGASSLVAVDALAGSRSVAASGASQGSTAFVSAPSASRSLARSGAPVAIASSASAASVVRLMSGAPVAVAAASCRGSRSASSSGATSANTSFVCAPSASRSLATSGACVCAVASNAVTGIARGRTWSGVKRSRTAS